MRAPLLLGVGLAVGITGAMLFKESFPPEAGSVQARLEEMERELVRTRVQLAAAEARAPNTGPGTREKLARGAHSIIEDLKDGKTVDMDDVYQAAKPALRDLAPIFERLRRRDLLRHNEFKLADLTRKYHLTPAQQDALRAWQQAKTEEKLTAMREFTLRDGTTLEDMAKAGQRMAFDDGLDAFMASTLTGKDLTQYQSDRLNQRVEQVQAEADRRVSRLHQAVELDDAQQDQVFSLMARSSPEFDPSMQFEGLTGDSAKLSPGQSRDEAIMEVLRPEQRERYEEHRIQRRQQAEKEFSEVGIRLPASWDMFGD